MDEPKFAKSESDVPHALRAAVQNAVASSRNRFRAFLEELARIPSVSWPSYDSTQVARSATLIADSAKATGIFDSVDMYREATADGSLGQPSVIARREPRRGAPTVLLYAHHDVQPAGDPDSWNTKPFEPTQIGDRLYGRGVADDKAGVVSHFAAIDALYAINPDSGLGIVMFIEGEEEYGSPSFLATLDKHREELNSDVIIVADSGNWSTEIPALTVSLRGNATLRVTVRTLDHALHSGMFGGAVPDAMLATVQLLARLHHADGTVAVPGLVSRVASVPEYSEQTFRAESGLLPGVSVTGSGPLMDRLWNQPSITVIGLDAPATADASNTLLSDVTVMVSLRVAPGQNSAEAAGALKAFLEASPPFGAYVDVEVIGTGSAFEMSGDNGPAGQIRAAMKLAWGVEPVDMGVGGSIPFIAEFVKEFPEAVVLVTGIEDPDTRAHSPNESLHLPSFDKAIVAQAIFLAGLAG